MDRRWSKRNSVNGRSSWGGGRKVTSVWVFRVQLFQLRCMCEHFRMKDWEKIFYRKKEAHLLVLFTPAPSLKSQTYMHLPESSNLSREAGIIPI